MLSLLKLVIITFCFTFSVCEAANTITPDGFRSFKWAQSMQKMPEEFKLEYILIKKDDLSIKDTLYQRIIEDYKIGDANAQLIEYYFWNDKFYQFNVWTDGQQESLNLIKSAKSKFGRHPQKTVTDHFVQYHWSLDTIFVMLHYQNYQGERFAQLSVKYMPLVHQREKWIKEQNEKPASLDGW